MNGSALTFFRSFKTVRVATLGALASLNTKVARNPGAEPPEFFDE